MRPVRNLNINNTYRSLNLNTTLGYNTYNTVKVTAQTKAEVLQDIKQHKYASRYLLYHTKAPGSIGEDDKLNAQVLNTPSPVSYFTTNEVPIHILLRMADKKNCEVVYTFTKEFTDKQIRNVQSANAFCHTVVEANLIYPDDDYRDLLFSVWDLRYVLDQLRLSFPDLTKEQVGNRHAYYAYNKTSKRYQLRSRYKYKYYENLHEVLARWKIQLWIVTRTLEEGQYLMDKATK